MIQLKVTPEAYATIGRCIKEDFDAAYEACKEDPFADNSDLLDRMEEDADAMKSLLWQIGGNIPVDAIEHEVAGMTRKIAEVS